MIIKVGILGAGRVAKHYEYILNKYNFKNCKIVGVADINVNNAKSISKKLHCKYYSSLEEMTQNHQLNLILILTPSGLHFSHVKNALGKNINVLVEKPISMKPIEIKKLITLSDKKKLLLAVAFQNRLNPAILFARDILKRKKLGKIISSSVRLRWCRLQEYYNDDWHGTWYMDGGVLNQQAIHHIDAINLLLGPVKSVSSSSANRVNILEAEDTIVSILRMSDGSLSTFEATTAARPKDIEASLSITGDKGYINISGIALNEIIDIKYIGQKKQSKVISKKHSEKVPNGYGLSHRFLIEGIIKKLNGKNNNNVVYAKDCISTTELVHAIYKSNEDNKWQHLSDNPLSSKLGVKK